MWLKGGVEMYRVLVLDENENFRQFLYGALSSALPEYSTIVEFDNVFDCIKYAEENYPDIIITDTYVNNDNALEQLKNLRKKVKIILFAEKCDITVAKLVVEMGVFSIIQKPSTEEEVSRVIKKAIESIESYPAEDFKNEKKRTGKQDKRDELLNLKNLLIEALESNDTKTINRCMSNITKVVKKTDIDDIQFVRRYYTQLLFYISDIRTELSYDTSDIEGSNYIKNIADMAAKCNSFTDLNDVLAISVANIMKVKDKNHQKTLSKHTKQAIEYIQGNYFTSPSLDDVASHCGLNSEYMSRIFKKETGKPMIEYINILKVERAKELFREKKRRIYEVANLVGIPDTHYFSTIFKKYVGITPTEYIKDRHKDENIF